MTATTSQMLLVILRQAQYDNAGHTEPACAEASAGRPVEVRLTGHSLVVMLRQALHDKVLPLVPCPRLGSWFYSSSLNCVGSATVPAALAVAVMDTTSPGAYLEVR